MLQERISLLHQAARKYRVQPKDLLKKLEELKTQLESTNTQQEKVKNLKYEITTMENTYDSLAEEITRARKLSCKTLATIVTNNLNELGLANSNFEIDLTPIKERYGKYGNETVSFSIRPNLNSEPGPIGKIATEWRDQFNIPIIGITGSNGKTSTKELLRHILSSKFDIHATEGNFNTSIGLPLTLLQLNAFHGASILEMGANQPGDIEILAKIANPNFGLITNIAPAHLEGFGSIEAVAKTKAAIFENLGNGIAFVNAADRRVKEITVKGHSISFGLNPDCDYPADLHYEEDGTITLTINTEEIPTLSSNLSFAKNIIACCAIARELGVEWEAIKDRVSTFSPPKGRCEVKNNGSYIIIDDTYNACLLYTSDAADE